MPFLSPGDLPNPGIEPGSPTLEADALPTEPPGKPNLKKKKKTKTESEKKCRLSLLSPGLSKMRMCVYELFKHGGWVRKEEGDGSDGQYRKKRMSLLVITSTTLYIWKILSREAFGECFFAVCYIKSLS